VSEDTLLKGVLRGWGKSAAGLLDGSAEGVFKTVLGEPEASGVGGFGEFGQRPRSHSEATG